MLGSILGSPDLIYMKETPILGGVPLFRTLSNNLAVNLVSPK